MIAIVSRSLIVSTVFQLTYFLIVVCVTRSYTSPVKPSANARSRITIKKGIRNMHRDYKVFIVSKKGTASMIYKTYSEFSSRLTRKKVHYLIT